MNDTECKMAFEIRSLRQQLAAQRAIVAADDEYRLRVKVTWDAVGSEFRAATLDSDAAWTRCLVMRAKAKRIEEGERDE